MYKGKYLLLSAYELNSSISNYLGAEVYVENRGSDESPSLKLILSQSDIMHKDIKDLISKIVGNRARLIEKATLQYGKENEISLNMEECSFMFDLIFNINNKAVFEAEVILDDTFVYLFYREDNEDKSINLHKYICECGTHFGIGNETGDSGVRFCPYCGRKRDDMGYDAFDGEFRYIVIEEN